MAIVLVEAVSAISNGATPGVSTATLGTATTAGELILVVFMTAPSQTQPASISDNLSQTYTARQTSGDASAHFANGMWELQNSASGVTSVNMHNAGTDTEGGILVLHYTGVATVSALDQSAAIIDGGSTTFASSNITTTNANDLLFTWAFGHNNGGSNLDLNATGSWTERKEIVNGGGTFDGGNGMTIWCADQIVAATGTYSGTGTVAVSTADHIYVGIASYKAAAAGSPPLVTTEAKVTPKPRRGPARQVTYITPAIVNIPPPAPPQLSVVKPRRVGTTKQKEPLKVAQAPVVSTGPAPVVATIAQVKPKQLAPVHRIRVAKPAQATVLAAGAAPVVTTLALVKPRRLAPSQQLHKGQRLALPVVTAASSQQVTGLPIVGVGT